VRERVRELERELLELRAQQSAVDLAIEEAGNDGGSHEGWSARGEAVMRWGWVCCLAAAEWRKRSGEAVERRLCDGLRR